MPIGDRRVLGPGMRDERARIPSNSLPYRNSARVYDRVYAWKDYRAEARRVRELVRRYGPPRARTLLDVACGTGSHLAYLSRWYSVTGIDASREMLREARRKLPAVRFVQGRMQDFRLDQRFDVIMCLFSAIGHVRSRRDLTRTLANFARHLNPRGVAIVEPWLTPGRYRVGSIHLATSGTTVQPIARMNSSERRGNRSVMDMHYLVADNGKVRYWVERHDLALFDVPTQLEAFRAAGLGVRHIPSRFTMPRGLYVGTLPEIPIAPRGPAAPRKRSRRRLTR